MENENMTTITRTFRVSADQMAQAARECAGMQIPVPDEKMEAIFNVSSSDAIAAFNRAKDTGFPWQFFTDRIQQKARLQGMLPQQGMLIILPRYVETASYVLDALLSSAEAVGDPSQRSRLMEPWKVNDVQLWRQMLCSFSVSMFDAGVVAALTLGTNPKFDPVHEGCGYAVFGDVGIMGLRGKAVSFVEAVAGAPAVNAMAKVGNEACVHLKWDSIYSGMAFKLPSQQRSEYFYSACQAAYIAGACFVDVIRQHV
jgi:hypothetical protein